MTDSDEQEDSVNGFVESKLVDLAMVSKLHDLQNEIMENMDGRILRARRASWKTAREVISRSLQTIANHVTLKEPDLSLYVRSFEHLSNFGSVQMSFGRRPTGIDIQIDGSYSRGVEDGAALVFGQGESGKVYPVLYPFITNMPNAERRTGVPWIGRAIEPSEITSESVAELAMDFLRCAPSTSIYWNSEPRLPELFVPTSTADVDPELSGNISELLRQMRVQNAFVVDGIPRIVNDVGRLVDRLEDDEVAEIVRQLRKDPIVVTLLRAAIPKLVSKAVGQAWEQVLERD